ncbi:MAG: ABC transporter permease subunit [Planctomycetes bacterium]|nr:ABC transporter permease subunit [Planctomycetota bacterium]
MRLPGLDPITRRRWRRFRALKRGYVSLVILLVAIGLSLAAEFIANHRAIMVKYRGTYYFPTFRFYPKKPFGQEAAAAAAPAAAALAEFDRSGDAETDYRALRAAWRGTAHRVFMPLIPYGPCESDFDYASWPTPPDSRHWLGTDAQGRDVLARLLYGFRISIFFALGLAVAAQAFGVAVGSLQGYLGGRFDLLSQRLIEVWTTLPFLYIVIILAALFAPSFWMLLGIMTAFSWMRITFYMRTEMYREKTRAYCLAARAIGASHGRIVFAHLLPNCLTPVVTFTPFLVVGAITALASLDYLGYGLPAPTPSWGEMIDQALRPENRRCLWLLLAPFAALAATLTLVTFVGESIREAFDPVRYARYE